MRFCSELHLASANPTTASDSTGLIVLHHHVILLFSKRLEEMLELKEALQKQLDAAKDKLSTAEQQLADSRKESEALAGKLKTAEEAKSEAEQVIRV